MQSFSFTTQDIHKVPLAAKAFLVALLVLQSSAIDLGATLSAWNVSASIEGNSVTTGELSETSETVIVTKDDLADDKAAEQANPTSWFFYNDQTDLIDNTLGSFVDGPDAPLYGDGSAQISVSGAQRRNLATYLFSGIKLANITELSFTTYNPSAGNGGSATRSAYLNFNVDFNGSDAWQRRLEFVPANNDGVTQDLWQEHDAIDGGTALWGWSGFADNGNQWPDGNTVALRSWNDLLVAFPDIAVRTTDSWLGLRVGEPYADGYTENIDSFTIGTQSGFSKHTVTYDFEPTAVTNSSELIISTPSNMNSWAFAPENTVDGQSGQMVAGPSTAPLGAGSAQLLLTDTDEAEILVTNVYAGTRLDALTQLKYSTYRTLGDAAVAPALSFEFDNDLADADTGWRGRMVYEPYHTQTVQTGVWQEWNTLNDAAGDGSGSWWGSPNGLSTLDEACPQSDPCTWAQVLALYPNAGIRDTGSPLAGLLLFKAGSGWAGFNGNVDKFVIGVQTGSNIHTVTHDFEPEEGTEEEEEGAQPGDVVINEIMWMGSDPSDGGSTADEWIELRNMTSEPIDLSGWTIENLGTEPGDVITIPSGIIEANGYFLIGNYPSDDENSAIADSIAVDYDTLEIQLLNSGEELILADADSTVIDQTPEGNWAAGNNTGGKSRSMERNMLPGDGTATSSWHTCIDTDCTSTVFWDPDGDNYGTPRGENLSENDPTMPDYIEQDWSHTIGWEPDENDEVDDSQLVDTGIELEKSAGGGTIESFVALTGSTTASSTATTTASSTDAATANGAVPADDGENAPLPDGDILKDDPAPETPAADEDGDGADGQSDDEALDEDGEGLDENPDDEVSEDEELNSDDEDKQEAQEESAVKQEEAPEPAAAVPAEETAI